LFSQTYLPPFFAMYLSSECVNALKYSAFWQNTNDPSLKNFLEFQLQMGDLKDPELEYR
ncbi:31653_t:CDS:2, partial [Racocetra persica]